MRKPHRITWLVMAALCVAVAAHAAGHRAPAPPSAPAAPQQVQAPAPPDAPDAPDALQPGAPDMPPGPEMADMDDEFAFLADDDLLAAGPADDAAGGTEKHVIVRRIVSGPGRAEAGNEEGCGAGCGCAMHRGAGPGMGMGQGMGHPGMMGGPGMGMGMGPGPGMRHPGMGMGAPGMRRGPLGGLGAKLQLTDAQREKLADIRDRQVRRGIQAHADLQIAQLDLRKAMHADRPDAGSINTQIDHIARVRADLAKARVASLLEARSVLTAEQQEKLKELHGRGPGGRGGMDGGEKDSDGQGTRGGHRMRMHGQGDSTGSDSQ